MNYMKLVVKTMSLSLMIVLAIQAVDSLSLAGARDTKWTEWKNTFQKSYSNEDEENVRHAIWFSNLQMIEKHNIKANRSFSMGLNEWSDLTPTEFRILMMKKAQGGDRRKSNLPRVKDLPTEVDWRKKGCVSPVEDQGEIMRSWAFSAIGSLEGRHCIITKKLKSLDVKKLDECCSFCYSVVHGFRYMITHNREAQMEEPVGTWNENCNFSTASYGASLTGYVELPAGSEVSLQRAVALIGPVAVTIDAGLRSFQLYVDGVYDEPSCSSTQLDHAVLVVGYGTLNGQDYWLVKNSWGVNWGMDGYILMARNKQNQCGIATAAVYPTGVTAGDSGETLLF